MKSAAELLSGVSAVLQEAAVFYLDLHAHPDLSGAEARTAGKLAERLHRAGYAVSTGIGGHGVVGILRNGAGPTVLLRAELDALPVKEETGLPYASGEVATGADGRQVPVMHACGHDLHLACLAGAASVLAAERAHWRGTVAVVGQPAEETLEGARAMLSAGLYHLTGRPDVVLAQHSAPFLAGMLAFGAGPVMAGSVSLDITILGRGGHAATPHLTVDPVVIAAAVVLRLQTVVSREVDPAEQVVLTVGSLRAGETGNVIPAEAVIGLTIRAFDPATLDRVVAAVTRIVRAECVASGADREPQIRRVSSSPVNLPDAEATAVVRAAHEATFGAARIATWPRATATEDFPLFGDAGSDVHGHCGVPTVYWLLGVASPRQWSTATTVPVPANHSPVFAPHVALALPTGISAMTLAALAHLRR
ncbi:amidohydrolase [Micromonospora radicis]|uniref:Amidohydrolase n=1 Tax=Micromonospora radicis TaxID=1894971 RepID=A0A418MYR9_9ACTN|nr:amidohydrolase [Micromonospora radicis]RIV40370.1 amidohydrolase [Micromonospora radicis]